MSATASLMSPELMLPVGRPDKPRPTPASTTLLATSWLLSETPGGGGARQGGLGFGCTRTTPSKVTRLRLKLAAHSPRESVLYHFGGGRCPWPWPRGRRELDHQGRFKVLQTISGTAVDENKKTARLCAAGAALTALRCFTLVWSVLFCSVLFWTDLVWSGPLCSSPGTQKSLLACPYKTGRGS